MYCSNSYCITCYIELHNNGIARELLPIALNSSTPLGDDVSIYIVACGAVPYIKYFIYISLLMALV